MKSRGQYKSCFHVVKSLAFKKLIAYSSDKMLVWRFVLQVWMTNFEIASDKGIELTGLVIQELLIVYLVQHKKVANYNPQANGQAESTNKVHKIVSTKYMWMPIKMIRMSKVQKVLLAYKTTYKIATDAILSRMLFGTKALTHVKICCSIFWQEF